MTGLQLSLQRLSQEFNSEIGAATAALLPGSFADDEAESENAYALRGIPGVPDNFFYIEEWIADHVGVVKRYC